MIEKHFLFPQYYILKIPKCDKCNVKLQCSNTQILSNPPKILYVCPKCNKEYSFLENEIQGEWKWRQI